MLRALAATAVISAAGLATTACGGARQDELDATLTEMRSDLRGLREAYETQNRRLEVITGRLELAEDQLEARALHPLPDRLPVVRLSPAHGGGARVVANPTSRNDFPVDADLGSDNQGDGDGQGDGDSQGDGHSQDDGQDDGGNHGDGITPPVRPGEQLPATITQADIDRLDGGGGYAADDAATDSADSADPTPAPRRRARRPVPPPANAAFAGNIGTRPLAPQPDFDAAAEGPIAAFRNAEARYRQGDLAAAIQGFEAVVATWPEHGFADNALYLVGRCRYDRAEYPGALGTFRAVLTTYPTGNQVPDALLMIGLTLDKLGRAAEGRETLARLRAMYPDTAAARQAAARLDRLPERM